MKCKTNKHLYFVTTSTGKFEEINRWVNEIAPNIKLEQAVLDIPEIQSLDAKEVAIKKAKDAWQIIQKPLLIDDAGLFLDKYKLFPGTLSKHIYEAIGVEGVIILAGENKIATHYNYLVYITGPEDYKIFLGSAKGRFVDPKEPIEKPLTDTQVFMPDGSNKTFYELKGSEEEKKYRHRYKALKSFLEWLNNQD